MAGKAEVTIISDKCLIVVPKAFREYYGLKPGDKMRVLFGPVMVVVPPNAKLTDEKKQMIELLVN